MTQVSVDQGCSQYTYEPGERPWINPKPAQINLIEKLQAEAQPHEEHDAKWHNRTSQQGAVLHRHRSLLVTVHDHHLLMNNRVARARKLDDIHAIGQITHGNLSCAIDQVIEIALLHDNAPLVNQLPRESFS